MHLEAGACLLTQLKSSRCVGLWPRGLEAGNFSRKAVASGLVESWSPWWGQDGGVYLEPWLDDCS